MSYWEQFMKNSPNLPNKRITVIVGLPGSGKTHLGQHLVSQTGGMFIDDVDKSGGLEAVSKAINSGVAHLVLSDPNLCEKVNQKNARSFLNFNARTKGYNVSWIYFENNVEKCRNNVVHRATNGDNRRVDGAIKLWSNIYYIPEDANVVGVWQPGEPSEDSLNEAGTRLAVCSVCGHQLLAVEMLLCGKIERLCLLHMGQTKQQPA